MFTARCWQSTADGSVDENGAFLSLSQQASTWGADITGNWLAATPNGDGTLRKVWLNLKNQNGRVTGTHSRDTIPLHGH